MSSDIRDLIAPGRGLRVERVFSKEGVSPYDRVEWAVRDAVITAADGAEVFRMNLVEAPASWSQNAVNVAASKYFRKAGVPGDPGYEHSVRQLVARVAGAIRLRGESDGYFAAPDDAARFEDELTEILLNQYAAFNSPVFFGAGLYESYGITGAPGGWAWYEDDGCFMGEGPREQGDAYSRPQLAACFLLKIEDSLEGIMQALTDESRIFKFGSGSGCNVSALRSKYEKLSGGGKSSGLMSFLEVFDKSAGSIKSGGTVRRAATMRVLNADHPEIVDFINWKAREERKAKVLIAAGYPSDFNGEAYQTVSGQNSNNSVRVTDEFMKAVVEDGPWSTRLVTTGQVHRTFPARDLWNKIGEAAWSCADPGLQFDTTINYWHTVPVSGMINTSNPCQPGWAPVLTPSGIRRLADVYEGDLVWSGREFTRVAKKWSTGVKPVFRFHTRAGSFVGTRDHKVFCRGERVPAGDAEAVDLAVGAADGEVAGPEVVLAGLLIGDGTLKVCNNGRLRYPLLCIGQDDGDYFTSEVARFINPQPLDKKIHRVETVLEPEAVAAKTYDRQVPDWVFYNSTGVHRAFLRGLYSANGSVCGNRVTLKASSFRVIDRVQQMLSAMGIRSYYTTNRAHDVEFSNGVYTCKENYDLNVSVDRCKFRDLIGFIQTGKSQRLDAVCDIPTFEERAKVCYDVVDVEPLGEEEVFDLTVEAEEHSYWTGGLLVSNCAEYVHLDSTSCNLASLNLKKFIDSDGVFDSDRFRHACRVLIIAQEIVVDYGSYPTYLICENTHNHRPLGLGYANLGASLMALGLPYDSPDGRRWAANVTALMTGEAYATSAALAAVKGPFPRFEANREPMIRVIEQHMQAARDADLSQEAVSAWEDAHELGVKYGYRNSQATVIAPTGTIGILMDCATTGVEPDFSLVKHKLLAGGGTMKIVNDTVDEALRRLGYIESDRRAIRKHIDETGAAEGTPFLMAQHLPVFDCANPVRIGGRYIEPMGHVRMVAAVQPFLSGGVSKTVNMPNHSTISDILHVYMQAWLMGVKCVSVYRDGSKGSQPLSSAASASPGYDSAVEERVGALRAEVDRLREQLQCAGTPKRRPLPNRRRGVTQKIRMGGQKLYLSTGEYEDGSLGEIFLTLAKAGSTLQGMVQALAMSVSAGLQYGVPLEEYVEMYAHTRFEPAGMTDHANVRQATSILDLVARVLGVEYLGRDDLAQVPFSDPARSAEPTVGVGDSGSRVRAEVEAYTPDSPFCGVCGHLMVRNGTCHKCLVCGGTSGCS